MILFQASASVVSRYQTGELDRSHAFGLLVVCGLSDEDAGRALDDTKIKAIEERVG